MKQSNWQNSADLLLLTCVNIVDSCQSVLKHRRCSSLHGGVNLLLLPHTGELCTCHTSWTASLRQHRKHTNEWRLSRTLHSYNFKDFWLLKGFLLLKVVSTSSTAYFFGIKACVYTRVCWEVGSVSIQIKSCIRQESCGHQDLPHRLTSLPLQFLYLFISCFISHQLFVLAVIRWFVKSNYRINLFSLLFFLCCIALTLNKHMMYCTEWWWSLMYSVLSRQLICGSKLK